MPLVILSEAHSLVDSSEDSKGLADDPLFSFASLAPSLIHHL